MQRVGRWGGYCWAQSGDASLGIGQQEGTEARKEARPGTPLFRLISVEIKSPRATFVQCLGKTNYFHDSCSGGGLCAIVFTAEEAHKDGSAAYKPRFSRDKGWAYIFEGLQLGLL